MKYKPPEILDIEIKGLRGVFQPDINMPPLETPFIAVAYEIGNAFAKLKPGEETLVTVPVLNLPLNANVLKITGKLLVKEDTSDIEPQQTIVDVDDGAGIKGVYSWCGSSKTA